jgi:DNA-binding LacI/PurR family transcriptional regulator
MTALVRHLIEIHEYRRLAYIGGLPDTPSVDARYAAYVAALAEYDVPLSSTIWMESEGAGKGSSFCFTLPLAPQ